MSDPGSANERGMDLIELGKVLLRQWLVLLVGAVITAVVGLGVAWWIPPTYQASGQVILLLKPEATGEDTPTNPYLNLDSNLTTVASLLATSLSTPGAQEDLEEAGFEGEVSVVLQPGVGPVVSISTAHRDSDVALRTRDEVIARMQEGLVALQADTNPPARQVIESRILSAPDEPVRLSGSKLRALVVVGALGAITGLTVAMVKDRGRQRRSG